ncbi:MAG: UDP-N-acetylglucosamine--N-acetylmuramyl-(pentapeptide) pyrophosphoryl-undecaprenol N-acetylglucosamine transferase [Patescibacteria group bacterium]|nr:UDP-N-acetylglucosamine--N-acetylmuramyl-(pentapeptide) pyrophosphoryl-undecaprenol N-acetylglucosamine transferase [Patescibacteria group bacterium]
MKILISGGHLTPALALIDYVKLNKPQIELAFAGRLYSQSGRSQRSREQQEIKKRQIAFFSLHAVRFANIDFWLLPLSLPQFFWSLIQAQVIFGKTKPDIFLSFGGYLAVPLALIAKLKGIPIITHEQTTKLGLANQLISRMAVKTAVSYTQTLCQIPKKKGVLTGNPMRAEILLDQPQPEFLPQVDKPVIYVTGGSLGSEIINTTLAQILPQLLKKYIVIHQCGPATKHRSYAGELDRLVNQLPKPHQQRYFVRDWIESADLAWIYRHASCVVSRAGANTTLELKQTATPCVLIPLPFAYNDEQLKNAKDLARTGGCLIIEQRQLGSQMLFEAIQQVIQHHYQYHQKMLANAVKTQLATQALLEVVEGVVNDKS